MAKKILPRNGNDQDVLAGHLTKLHVWRLLLLHGSHATGSGEDEIAEKLARAGVHLSPGQVGQLYHLAVQHAKLAAA